MKTKSKDILKLLKDTDRKLYIDEEVVKFAPTGEGIPEFFKLDRYVTDDELEKEYESRGLISAPLNVLCEYDIKNPKDMDEKKYIGTHWKDSKGKWCFAAFRRWRVGERKLHVNRCGSVWRADWWFAGLRKSDLKSLDTENSLCPLILCPHCNKLLTVKIT